jgi:hypothetical protein
VKKQIQSSEENKRRMNGDVEKEMGRRLKLEERISREKHNGSRKGIQTYSFLNVHPLRILFLRHVREVSVMCGACFETDTTQHKKNLCSPKESLAKSRQVRDRTGICFVIRLLEATTIYV